MTERSSDQFDRFAPDAAWPAWRTECWDPVPVHVIRVWLPNREPFSQQDFALLSADEQARARRFLIDIVRTRFVACRAILRCILAELVQHPPQALEFDYGEHGKPRLATPWAHRLSFNVSHSADAAVIALAWNRELGVDIEFEDARDWRSLARRFFAAAEWKQIESLPVNLQAAGFYRIWTLKEAYLKATGRGMSLPLGSFTVCGDPRLPPRLMEVRDNPGEVARWHAATVNPGPSFAGAVFWDGSNDTVRQWTWTNPIHD